MTTRRRHGGWFPFLLLVFLAALSNTVLCSELDHEPNENTPPLPFVLVTGANGLIGSSLVHELLKRGHRVRGTVRDPTNPLKTESLQSFDNADTHLELVKFELKEQQDASVYEQLMEGGIDWVFHVAAVVDLKGTYDQEEQILQDSIHALRGLLQAAAKTPSVSQFVYTGSAAAITQGHAFSKLESHVFNEDDWTNLEEADANDPAPAVVSYARIKTLTERSAWEFVEQQEESPFRFSSILPTIVLGEMTSPHHLSSMRLIQRIMEGKDPGLVNMFVNFVDMRDVVQAHIQAAAAANPTLDEDKSRRRRFFLAQTEGGSVFLPEIARVLREHFEPMGYKIRTWLIPKWIIWILSWWDAELAFVYPRIDVRFRCDTSLSQQAPFLNLTYRNATETLLDSGHALIQHGVLPKTKGYQERSTSSLSTSGNSAAEL